QDTRVLLGLMVRHVAWNECLTAYLAGNHLERLEVELLAQQQRDLAAVGERGPFAGIEIEDDRRGALDERRTMQERMDLDAADLRDPEQRALVVDHHVMDVRRAVAARHGKRADPIGREARGILLPEKLAVERVGVAFER